MNWLVELDSCPSTNTWALANIDRLVHGDVVHTRRQTAGRGREGRSWQAPPGVLTCSVVLDTAGADLRAVGLAAGLACIHAIVDVAPGLDQDLAVKWPNDVLLCHRKVAGILCEGSAGRLVVGIGLNRAAELPETLGATSLHLHALPPDEGELITAMRSYLLEAVGLIAARGLDALLPQLRSRDVLLGRSLTVATRTGEMHGIGGGIDTQGRLLLVVAHGGIAEVDVGHITAW